MVGRDCFVGIKIAMMKGQLSENRLYSFLSPNLLKIEMLHHIVLLLIVGSLVYQSIIDAPLRDARVNDVNIVITGKVILLLAMHCVD